MAPILAAVRNVMVVDLTSSAVASQSGSPVARGAPTRDPGSLRSVRTWRQYPDTWLGVGVLARDSPIQRSTTRAELGGLSQGFRRAEREGFEPSMEREPHTRLAGECLQPLGHLSEDRESQCKGCPDSAEPAVMDVRPRLGSGDLDPEGWQSGRMHWS